MNLEELGALRVQVNTLFFSAMTTGLVSLGFGASSFVRR